MKLKLFRNIIVSQRHSTELGLLENSYDVLQRQEKTITIKLWLLRLKIEDLISTIGHKMGLYIAYAYKRWSKKCYIA